MTVIHHPIRLTESEQGCLPWLDLEAEDVREDWDGPVIVGEMPGKRTDPDCPMFPYPHTSAGGRLMKMSGLAPIDYLTSFHRVNLVERFFKSWPCREAQKYAREMLEYYRGRPIVCLGSRVAEAFGLVYTFTWHQPSNATPLIWVPHPSGLNRKFNTELNRTRTGDVLRQALQRWRRPNFAVAGDMTCTCGSRIDSHPLYRPELGAPLRLCCNDTVWLAWPEYPNP